MSKTFNFYCDESAHLENDGKEYMLLSYVSTAYNQVKLHNQAIRDMKRDHSLFGEIKWAKVSHSQYAFYADLIDYFFATDLNFRAVVVNKKAINNDGYQQDFDTFYYKMYYQLLYHKMDMQHAYNIYLDIKDTLSAFKVNHLKKLLQLDYSSIRNLQNIRSHESELMQLTDVLMGAISYRLNNHEQKVLAKKRLIDKIEKHTSLALDKSTPKANNKFNLFFIDLK